MSNRVRHFSRSGRRTRVSASSRGGSWVALCVLYIVGWIAQGLHLSQSSHTVCEHGAIEHVDAPHVDDPGHVADGAGPHWDAVEQRSDESHHHCAIATQTAVLAFEWVEPTPAVLPPAVGVPRLRRTAPRVPSEPLFALAPHHSPPLG